MLRRAWSWLGCAIAARAAPLTPAQRDAFFEDGLVVLGKLLDEAAVAAIEVEYDRFMSGIHAEEMGKDFTDMSKPFGTPFEEWSVVNGMLPHRYHPPLRNNAWERLAAEIAAGGFPGVEMVQVPRGAQINSLSTHPSFTGRFAHRITTSCWTNAPARATPSSRCIRTWRIGHPRPSRPTTRAPLR